MHLYAHAQSLLCEATPAVEPELSAWAFAFSMAGAVAAIAVAGLLGIFRPSRVGLGHRVPLDRPIAPFVGVLAAGFVFWIAAPGLLLHNDTSRGQHPTTQAAPAFEDLSPRELMLIGAAVPAAAFLVLLAGDGLIRPHVGQQLGFSRRRFPRGLAFGVIGLLLAMPIVYAAMVVSEWIYRAVHYTHPSEHDLLRVMGETADPIVKYVIVAAAVLIAPLWEELLFRGHVQTLIRELLIRVTSPPPQPADAAFALEQPGPGEVLSYARAATPVDGAHPLPSWIAIIVTSAMFAGVHAPWQMPAIFVLSLCLGFAYERTNNLWVCVTMHAAFNTLMTAYFFLIRGGLN
jgi:membrane protease YdiL (CAAX protease family)